MDHADSVDEAANALGHAHRLAAVQRVAELLQRVQVFHVVLRLVGRISQLVVLLVPHLSTHTTPRTVCRNSLPEFLRSTETLVRLANAVLNRTF